MQGYNYTIPSTFTDKFDTSPCGNFSHPKYTVSMASVPYVRRSSKSSSDSASFSPPLVVVSKRKSFIVHIHTPLVAARYSPNKQVCRSLRSLYTNVRISPKARGLSSSRNRAALLSQAGADMARGIASWEQRQSSDLQNLVSQRGAEIFK